MSWPLVPLGEVANFINGKAFKPEEWGEEGLPIIRIQNLNSPNAAFNRYQGEIAKRYLVHDGDLLISWSASLDAFIWSRGDAVLNQHIFNAREREEKITRRYLYHVVRHAMVHIRSLVHGATMQHITKPVFEAIQIPLPPLSEQQRIAAILDKADALRHKRRDALPHLDRLLQSVFVEMFGEPITNPKGWPTCSIVDIAEQVTDGEHQTPIRSEEGIKLLSARNVKNGFLDFSNVDHVPLSEHQRIKKRCNPVYGDLLISCSGTIGRVATVLTDEPLSLVRSAALVKPAKKVINSRFMEFYLRTDKMKAKMMSRANASSQANLFIGQIKELPVFLPPLADQQKFAAVVEQVESLRARQLAAQTESDALFATLQARAFAGGL